MRTIIHIGQHKTGTTSIQHYLRNNKSQLAKKGLYVPDYIAGYENPSHFILNAYALDENRLSSMKEIILKTKGKEYFSGLKEKLLNDISKHYLIAEQQGCVDIIWTNEGLYLLRTIHEYERLRELFNGFTSNVTCICCFRDIESYKKSYTQQLLKQGITLSTDKDSYRYVNDDSWLFDYSEKTNVLLHVFDHVITFPYDKEDNVSAFLKNIGYYDTIIDSIRLNVTK